MELTNKSSKSISWLAHFQFTLQQCICEVRNFAPMYSCMTALQVAITVKSFVYVSEASSTQLLSLIKLSMDLMEVWEHDMEIPKQSLLGDLYCSSTYFCKIDTMLLTQVEKNVLHDLQKSLWNKLQVKEGSYIVQQCQSLTKVQLRYDLTPMNKNISLISSYPDNFRIGYLDFKPTSHS